MPIQITELHIAVSVSTPQATQSVTQAAPVANAGATKNLVNECVDQVVKIIRDKKER